MPTRPPLVTRPPLWLRRTLFGLGAAVVVAGAAAIPTIGAAPVAPSAARPAVPAAPGVARPAPLPQPLPVATTAPPPVRTAAARTGGGCPSGSLRWSLSSFTAATDPLDPHQVTVRMAGTVTNDGGATAEVLAAREQLVLPPVAGASAYPVYLVLDAATLAPGTSTRWQGQSPEVGYTPSQLRRGPLAVAAAWPASPMCPPPGHDGTP